MYWDVIVLPNLCSCFKIIIKVYIIVLVMCNYMHIYNCMLLKYNGESYCDKECFVWDVVRKGISLMYFIVLSHVVFVIICNWSYI